MKRFLPVTALLLCSAGFTAFANECDPARHDQSTPSERFTQNTNGTVTDKRTGLIWSRCSVGQTWTGANCAGQFREMTWSNAKRAEQDANTAHFADQSDWRIPAVPELASIVEIQCKHPRVNVEIFPATPSKPFWTSMEKRGANQFAYALDFGGGAAGPMAKGDAGAVRLVRGGPWWVPPSMKP